MTNTNILTNLPRRQAEHYDKNRQAIGEYTEGNTRYITWSEFADRVDTAAYALETLGLVEQQGIAVFAPNRAHTLIADFAAYANRAFTIGIYSTSSPEQIQYLLNDSRAAVLFVGDQAMLDTVLSVAGECSHLRHVIVYEGSKTQMKGRVNILTWADFMKLGAHASQMSRDVVARRRAEATAADIATLVYTSGTTGEPKGAILSHDCLNAALSYHTEALPYITDQDTSLCFLPLCHIFEKAWSYFCLYTGMPVTVNTDARDVQNALRHVRPTCMCSVPRFWEKVYTGIQDKIGRVGIVQRLIFKYALHVGRKRNLRYKRLGRRVPGLLEAQYRFIDKKILTPMQRVVGVDRGRMFPTAGAPLSANIVEFLCACGIPIKLGYGLSETTATVTLNPRTDWEAVSVGKALPGVDVRIGDENEVQVKGRTVMRGYFNKEAETEAAFTDDGWFRTGDAGRFDDAGNLILTERIKDLFKTSNGKYIAPQAIETRLGEDPYIEQVAVIGDRRKYVTALIIPTIDALKEYAQRKKIDFSSIDDLLANSSIRAMIEERLEKLQQGLANFEKIKKFSLLPSPFTIEKGELTNTLKLRRRVITDHYAPLIEAMYAV